MAACPECSTKIDVAEGSKAGEVLYCTQCDAELEIISLDPVQLALAPEIEEDWGE